MSAMHECTHTMPRPAMPVTECAPTTLGPAMFVHAVHECTPAMPMQTMSDCVPAAHAMLKPTWPVNECTLTTPTPTVPGHVECTYTVSTTSHSTVPMHVVSQSTVPGPTLPEG